jgi:flagellar hook-associated protein 1 FlgK
MSSLISIGVTGLTSNQMALGVTGNNISNASVQGYSRQRVNLVTGPEQFSGAGYVGSGVTVDSIQRQAETFAIKQLQQSTALYQDVNSQATQAGQLDSLLADQATGLATSLQGLFSALQQASQDPTSIPTRQVVLDDAAGLAQRFNSLYSNLQAQANDINQQLDAMTGQVTSMATAVARLNQEITAAGTSNPPNALLDKRDELIRQISELVGVSPVQQSNGMVNVYLGNGQPLVVGTTANALTTATSATDPTRREVVFQSVGGGSQVISSLVNGGTIGGLLKYRNSTLDSAFNTLGQIALNVADAMNQQQTLGLDLNGNLGQNLFTDINSSTQMLARVSPSSTNAGVAALGVEITDASALTNKDYRLDITAAGYQLTYADGSALNPAVGPMPFPTTLPATITTPDGFAVQIPAGSTFVPGDSYTLRPTRYGAQSIAVALQQPHELAFAAPITTGASQRNTGGGAISSGEMLAVYDATGTLQSTFAKAGALEPPLLVRFNNPPTTFDVLDSRNMTVLPGYSGQTFIAGQNNTVTINDPLSGDAVYSFTLSGNPAASDEFTVDYNSNGSSDNRNALALAALQDKATIGKSTFEDVNGQLVARVGSSTAQLKVNRDAMDSMLTQAQATRDAVSGVNLDEEAANLIKFQQAYGASAQVISVARELFDTLLAAFR